LKGIKKGKNTPVDNDSGSEDSKSSMSSYCVGQTNMDFVNAERNFNKISMHDLKETFKILQKRCPDTWNLKLEARANDFQKKISMLREVDLAQYIDPEKHKAYECKELKDPKDLILSPTLWNMYTTEAAMELRQVLHHFTIYAPFEGRPFIRSWLEALVSCFSRWILLSDSAEKKVIRTLKNFLGAFGQPGIVVCLADKGKKLLKTLQDSARSVEALGRGTVERYYWKRLAESSCGGNKDWRAVASIPNKQLVQSQLDTLPQDWLMDSSDFVHVFANIVSPEIGEIFEQRLEAIIHEKTVGTVHAGPAKTLARSIAKCHEYKSDYRSEKGSKRWSNFRRSFRKSFGRSPKIAADFVWNIVDFARCSINVPDAKELLKVKKIIEEHFKVVCVKNGYNADVRVKGSGYRDMKLLVEVEFDRLDLQKVPRKQGKINMICEIQLMCKKWLTNKKTTSLSYKVLRASNLQSLLDDFAKYLDSTSEGDGIIQTDATKILKNGWVNLAKSANFSNINRDQLLLDACQNGWEPAGVDILIRELNADIEAKDPDGLTPVAIAARAGHDDLVKSLIELRSNIETQDGWLMTALHHATMYNQESCIRILINAGCNLKLRDYNNETALDIAKKYGDMKRVVKLLKRQHVPPLKKKEKQVSKIDRIKTAAIEGSLTKYFDMHLVESSVVEKLMASQGVATKMENILQVLWFGGKLEVKDNMSFTAVCYSAQYGDLASLTVLLENGARVDVKDGNGWTPLHLAINFATDEMVKALVDAKADLESKLQEGWTALHVAAQYGSPGTITALIEAGADVFAKLDDGRKAVTILRGKAQSDENDEMLAILQAAEEKAKA